MDQCAALPGTQDDQSPRLARYSKRLRPAAKDQLYQIWMAEAKADAEPAFDSFVVSYQAKYPKATECLNKDRDVLQAAKISQKGTSVA